MARFILSLLRELTYLDRDAMDYFRAMAAAGEESERVLELTETIIRQNPAHYTVWWVDAAGHCTQLPGLTDSKLFWP